MLQLKHWEGNPYGSVLGAVPKNTGKEEMWKGLCLSSSRNQSSMTATVLSPT